MVGVERKGVANVWICLGRSAVPKSRLRPLLASHLIRASRAPIPSSLSPCNRAVCDHGPFRIFDEPALSNHDVRHQEHVQPGRPPFARADARRMQRSRRFYVLY